jgi:hypothetical protein
MAVVINGTSGITGNTGTLISASTIGVGGATPSASGAGITFPATANLSSNANTLDDYEEGTWTSVLTGGGSATAVPRTNNYQKIGNQVTIWLNYDTNISTGAGSGTTSLNMTGLPFQCTSASASMACGIRSGMDFNAVYLGGNASSFAFYKWSGVAWDNMKGSNITQDFYLGLVLSYVTAS